MQSRYNISEADSQFVDFLRKVKNKISNGKISNEVSGNVLDYIIKNTLALSDKVASDFVKTKISNSKKALYANSRWALPILIAIASYLISGNKAQAEEASKRLPTYTQSEMESHLGFKSGSQVSLRNILKHIYRNMKDADFEKMISGKYNSDDPRWEKVDLDKPFYVHFDYKAWNLVREKIISQGDDPTEGFDDNVGFSLPGTKLQNFVFINPNKVMANDQEHILRVIAHELTHVGASGGIDQKSSILTSKEFLGSDAVDKLVGDSDDVNYTKYASTMKEIDPRLADIVRLWHDHTGKTIDNKEEAKNALLWLLNTKSWKKEDFPTNVEKEMFQDLYLGLHKIMKVFKDSGGDTKKLLDVLSDRMKDVAVNTSKNTDVSNIAESMYRKLATSFIGN